MTPDQAVELADSLRDNWDVPAWSQGRYNLFVDALLPWPYDIGKRAVADLIFKGLGRDYRIRVEHVTDAAGRLMRRREAIEHASASRLQIAPPKDPEVARLLRETVEKLERRR